MNSEAAVGLSGAAACEVVGLWHPRCGAETDLATVAQVVPDRARRETLYHQVIAHLEQPEVEAEYQQTLAEIARLKQRLLDIAEEGWVRGETYRHGE